MFFSHLFGCIEGSKLTLYLALFRISCTQLVDLLIRAKLAGVDVRLLVDVGCRSKNFDELVRMARYGKPAAYIL